MERRYKKYAYLDCAAQFVLEVMLITDWSENYALARVVSSETYKLIKKNHATFSSNEVAELARTFCKSNRNNSGEKHQTKKLSEILHFKLFCFESYMEAKGIKFILFCLLL